MFTKNVAVLLLVWLLLGCWQSVCAAGKTVRELGDEERRSISEALKQSNEVLDHAREISGQPCWDDKLGTAGAILHINASYLEPPFSIEPESERRMLQKLVATDMLRFAEAWGARGCPYIARAIYIDVIESFTEPEMEAFRIRARIGLDDIKVSTHDAVLTLGPIRPRTATR